MALTSPSTLARVSSQVLLILLLLLPINIFFPFVRRVGVLFFTWAAKREQNDRHGDERRNAAERRVAGCGESARGVPNGVGFCLARTVLRPEHPAEPRGVQRHPPEAQRSG